MNHHEQQPKQEAVMTMSRKMMNTMSRRGFGLGPAGLALIWTIAGLALLTGAMIGMLHLGATGI